MDGTITVTGLIGGQSYTISYSTGGVATSLTLTADASGDVTITGLTAGSYTNIAATTILGCKSNLFTGPVVLFLPPTPPAPTAANNTPVCAGSDVNFTATDATTGVTYMWAGPGGFSSTLQNPTITAASTGASGVYSVTATKYECVSAPATTTVLVHPIPAIGNVSSANPGTCQGSDGSFTLSGLLAGVSYTITYSFNGAIVTTSITADASGNVTVTGLSAGTYSGIFVSSFTCVSNTVGPVTLADPNPPPVPDLTSNSPICAGKTLNLGASDANAGVTFSWSGPNGFTSDLQYPEIKDIDLSDSGEYTLTVWYLNCPATASEFVLIHPPVILKNVTASQTIGYGSSIQLNADGADYYLWSPNDGSLSDPNIRNYDWQHPRIRLHTLLRA